MNMPPRIQQLIEMIGIEAVMQLLKNHLLGREWHIGESRDTEWYREWSDVIGEGLTETVFKAWHGYEPMYLAKCHAALRRVEHEKIVHRYDALLKGGITPRRAIAQLVRETGKSDRWLRTIVDRPLATPPPIDIQMILPL